MKMISKTLMAAAVTTACIFGATNASAATFEQFSIDPLGNHANFVADKIIGNYTESINFIDNPGSTPAVGAGTFTANLRFDASSFVDTGNLVKPQYDATRTGLTTDYNIYGLYTATGNFSRNNGAATFTLAKGSLDVFIDPEKNTSIGVSASGFSITGNEFDTKLANGAALKGKGMLTGPTDTCGPGAGGGIFCGFVSSTTEFNLTPEGKLFFVAPTPFYQLSFQSGQLDNFPAFGNPTLTGSLDITFDKVPEPASVALLGLGLVGLGLSRRRKQS